MNPIPPQEYIHTGKGDWEIVVVQNLYDGIASFTILVWHLEPEIPVLPANLKILKQTCITHQLGRWAKRRRPTNQPAIPSETDVV